MNDKDWEKFFELLDKIVGESEQQGKPWQEIREAVKDQAAIYDAETSLEEFCGWFD